MERVKMKKSKGNEINIKLFLEKRFKDCENKIYLCSPVTFLTILLLEKKRLIRNNSKLFLLHFYFISEKEDLIYKFKNKIQNILNKNLRNSDVVTWVSFNHLIILLKKDEMEKVDFIKDRIEVKIDKSIISNYLTYSTKIKEITKPVTNKYNREYH